MALPEYPDLEELMDYISHEIKTLFHTEGALVILMDHAAKELFFLGAAYDDVNIQRKVKKLRFSPDQIVAGEVIMNGKAVILGENSQQNTLYSERDEKLGYKTKNLLEVPLKSKENVIGALCALNKKDGDFDQTDMELLNMIAGTVALSIENARFAKEIQDAYREVSSLNKAKNKALNRLSHELIGFKKNILVK